MRVLVVEDESSNRELLRRWLVEWQHDVIVTASATEALEAMLAKPADVMLVDIRMPGHDGFWLIERVRPKWPRTAIIMATGVVEMDAVKKSQQLGAIDYVTKPFGRQLMKQALDRAAAALDA
jgi:two-component system response regulator AtoC